MPRREHERLVRLHVWVYADDAEWLKDRFSSKTGVAKALRELVRSFRRKVEEKMGVKVDTAPPEDEITLEELEV
jgi:hypothetical protein